jgi:hypothetical protein
MLLPSQSRQRLDTLRETGLSPTLHQCIMRSQSRQSDDPELVGTLSYKKKKLVVATTLIPKLTASVLESSRLQTPKLTGALQTIKDWLSIGRSPLETMLSSFSSLFNIQTFKNSITSTGGIFKQNNKIGLDSKNMDEQPKDLDSNAQDVSIANMKDSNDNNAVTGTKIPPIHTRKHKFDVPEAKIMEGIDRSQNSSDHT